MKPEAHIALVLAGVAVRRLRPFRGVFSGVRALPYLPKVVFVTAALWLGRRRWCRVVVVTKGTRSLNCGGRPSESATEPLLGLGEGSGEGLEAVPPTVSRLSTMEGETST
jgi:hypothetical protein